MTLSALDSMTHTSGKTIRATYWLLRMRLAEAVLDDEDAFGRAGFYLSQPCAVELLNAIAVSAAFRRYRRIHAPRLKDQNREQLLVLEFAVRILCALDLRNVHANPESILQMLRVSIGPLKLRDPLQKLAESLAGARPHAGAGRRLYEDYRRHLLRKPAGQQSKSCRLFI
jgi:hypothetical protein